MVSTAMTITASRATTNPVTSPVGSLVPAEPGVVSSVVEVVLGVLVTSLLGGVMVLDMGDTMVVVMAMVDADVGVGQNIVEVNVERQLSLVVSTVVAV